MNNTVDSITYTIENGVGVMTLNRPEVRNAFDREMLRRWAEIINAAGEDPLVRSLLITGEGKSFCSGADLRSIKDLTSTLQRRDYLANEVHAVAKALERFEKPYIAAINGDAIGAGMDMALMADIRLISESARLSQGYIRVGLVPGDGGAYFLPRIVGEQRALELMWSGRFVDGKEAVELGLVLSSHPTEQLHSEALGLARRLAEGPPVAVRAIKRLTRTGRAQSLSEHLSFAAAEQAVVQSTADSQEAMVAFREKRSPRFLGH